MNNYTPLIGSADLWPAPVPGDFLPAEPPAERIDHLLDCRFVVFRMSAGDRFGLATCAVMETGEIIGRFWNAHLQRADRIRTDLANVRPLGEQRDVVVYERDGLLRKGFVVCVDHRLQAAVIETWRRVGSHVAQDAPRVALADVLPYRSLLEGALR